MSINNISYLILLDLLLLCNKLTSSDNPIESLFESLIGVLILANLRLIYKYDFY